MSEDLVNACLRGEALYGDNFDPREIALWFEQEEEAYSLLGAADRDTYRYGYHALNWVHGYSHLPDMGGANVLGLGSAWGDELLPLAGKVHSAIILDPSLTFASTHIEGIPITYRKPNMSGRIDLNDSSVDLTVCFGVLHHIPNVSYVIKEISRVLKPGGYFLLREPIVSMGDWRQSRHGLTKNERGIPYPILKRQLADANLEVRREALVDFAPLKRIFSRLISADPFNSVSFVKFDAVICNFARWSLRYHAVRPWHKFRPTSAFLVCRKSSDAIG